MVMFSEETETSLRQEVKPESLCSEVRLHWCRLVSCWLVPERTLSLPSKGILDAQSLVSVDEISSLVGGGCFFISSELPVQKL